MFFFQLNSWIKRFFFILIGLFIFSTRLFMDLFICLFFFFFAISYPNLNAFWFSVWNSKRHKKRFSIDLKPLFLFTLQSEPTTTHFQSNWPKTYQSVTLHDFVMFHVIFRLLHLQVFAFLFEEECDWSDRSLGGAQRSRKKIQQTSPFIRSHWLRIHLNSISFGFAKQWPVTWLFGVIFLLLEFIESMKLYKIVCLLSKPKREREKKNKRPPFFQP